MCAWACVWVCWYCVWADAEPCQDLSLEADQTRLCWDYWAHSTVHGCDFRDKLGTYCLHRNRGQTRAWWYCGHTEAEWMILIAGFLSRPNPNTTTWQKTTTEAPNDEGYSRLIFNLARVQRLGCASWLNPLHLYGLGTGTQNTTCSGYSGTTSCTIGFYIWTWARNRKHLCISNVRTMSPVNYLFTYKLIITTPLSLIEILFWNVAVIFISCIIIIF